MVDRLDHDARLCREPGTCEYEALAATPGVASSSTRTSFPRHRQVPSHTRRRTLRVPLLAGDETQVLRKGPTSSADGGLRDIKPPVPSSSTERLRRMWPRGTRGGLGQNFREAAATWRRTWQVALRVLQRLALSSGARTGTDDRKHAVLPVEAKRLRASSETKSVSRKTLEVFEDIGQRLLRLEWLVGRQKMSRLWTLNRLVTEFINLIFSQGHRAWKGEQSTARRPLLLSKILASARESTELGASQLSRSANKHVSKFFMTTTRRQQSEALFISPPGESRCHSDLRVSWHQRVIFRSWVILLFPQTGTCPGTSCWEAHQTH